MSYREVINVLIKWHSITHTSIICPLSYVICMYIYICICRWAVVRSSADGRPIVGRWTADHWPMQNRRVPMTNQLWIFFNVNARHRPFWESHTWLIGQPTFKILIARSYILLLARHYWCRQWKQNQSFLFHATFNFQGNIYNLTLYWQSVCLTSLSKTIGRHVILLYPLLLC